MRALDGGGRRGGLGGLLGPRRSGLLGGLLLHPGLVGVARTLQRQQLDLRGLQLGVVVGLLRAHRGEQRLLGGDLGVRDGLGVGGGLLGGGLLPQGLAGGRVGVGLRDLRDLQLAEDVDLVVGDPVQQRGALDQLARPGGVQQGGRTGHRGPVHVAVPGEDGDAALRGGDLRGGCGELGGGPVGVGLGDREGLLGRLVGVAGRLGLHLGLLELRLGGGRETRQAPDLGRGGVLRGLRRADLAVAGVARRRRCRDGGPGPAEDDRSREHGDERGAQRALRHGGAPWGRGRTSRWTVPPAPPVTRATRWGILDRSVTTRPLLSSPHRPGTGPA